MAKQATLSSATPITVSTLSCTSLSATGLLTALTCSGDATVAGTLSVTGNVYTTNGRFTAGGTARFYYNNYGSYNAAILSHPTNINLALSNSAPPLSTELAITMDTTVGIVLNKYTEAKAGLYVSTGDVTVSNNIYAYGDHYYAAAKTFYSPNFANPALWDKRLLLGHTTNDAIRMYAGPLGIVFLSTRRQWCC